MKAVLLFSFAVSFLLCSCSHDEVMANSDSVFRVPLVLSSATLQNPQALSRADAVGVLQSGSIGLFRTQGTGYNEELVNKRYEYNASKGWQPYSSSDTVFCFGNQVDIFAYYPYDPKHSDKSAIALTSGLYTGTVDDLVKHDVNDICYGRSLNLTAASPAIALTLNHAMSLLRLRLSRASYESSKCNISALKIGNSDLIHSATLDITASPGIVTPTSASGSPLEYALSVQVPASGSVDIEVLLVPCTLRGATTFKFTVDGKWLSASVDASKLGELQSGKIHQVNINVHAGSVTVSSVDIIEWDAKWDSDNEPESEVKYEPKDYIELGGSKWAIANLVYYPEHYNYSFGLTTSEQGTAMEWNALTNDTGAGNNGVWNGESDPCSRLEPKGTWSTASAVNYTALKGVAQINGTYNGVSGMWFGTSVIGQTTTTPYKYLFLPSSTYWTSSKVAANPQSMQLTDSGIQVSEGNYSDKHQIRCVKATK